MRLNCIRVWIVFYFTFITAFTVVLYSFLRKTELEINFIFLGGLERTKENHTVGDDAHQHILLDLLTDKMSEAGLFAWKWLELIHQKFWSIQQVQQFFFSNFILAASNQLFLTVILLDFMLDLPHPVIKEIFFSNLKVFFSLVYWFHGLYGLCSYSIPP